MSNQASKARTQQRVEELLRIRLDGAEFWDVREFVREKEAEPGSAWYRDGNATPLSDSQIRRLMSRADDLIAEANVRSRKRLVRLHLARRRNLYAKAVLSGDLRTALSCLQDEAKLVGLYAPDKVARTDTAGRDLPPIRFVEVATDNVAFPPEVGDQTGT